MYEIYHILALNNHHHRRFEERKIMTRIIIKMKNSFLVHSLHCAKDVK